MPRSIPTDKRQRYGCHTALRAWFSRCDSRTHSSLRSDSGAAFLAAGVAECCFAATVFWHAGGRPRQIQERRPFGDDLIQVAAEPVGASFRPGPATHPLEMLAFFTGGGTSFWRHSRRPRHLAERWPLPRNALVRYAKVHG